MTAWRLIADISQDGAAASAVSLAMQRFGRLDILVNNAGRIVYKNLVDLSRARPLRLIDEPGGRDPLEVEEAYVGSRCRPRGNCRYSA